MSGSIFKQSKISLNSEFSLSKTGCLTKAKDPHLLNYLPIVGGENRWIHVFLKQSEMQIDIIQDSSYQFYFPRWEPQC